MTGYQIIEGAQNLRQTKSDFLRKIDDLNVAKIGRTHEQQLLLRKEHKNNSKSTGMDSWSNSVNLYHEQIWELNKELVVLLNKRNDILDEVHILTIQKAKIGKQLIQHQTGLGFLFLLLIISILWSRKEISKNTSS